MTLQNVIWSNEICDNKQLFYKTKSKIIIDKECLIIPKRKKISFLSYMNMFDLTFWKKYTSLKYVCFTIEIKGKGVLFLKCKNEIEEMIIGKILIDTLNENNWKKYKYTIDLDKYKNCCFFEIFTENDMHIRNAKFESYQEKYKKEICIAVNICTYKRNEIIKKNISKLKDSMFFCENSDLYQKLYVVIIDNASELKEKNEICFKIIHNRNTGGSGGFMRGLDEIRRLQKNITHVVFMDDDVEFYIESLYRLHAFLSFVINKYSIETIAGRMFRTDKKYIQYTAAEIWNKSDLKHVGFNRDMRTNINILQSNKNENAEYGGWWFACYPIEFASANNPIPFFIHCDDAEYGLRHGGCPIILNGIQVWHETYEYRQNPIIVYYDIRNSFYLNHLYNYKSQDELYSEWFERISQYHIQCKWKEEKMAIYAFLHFLNGIEWLYKKDALKIHNKIIKKEKKAFKIENAILWRLVRLIYQYRKG